MKHGYTLLELLVVIAIIALVLGLLMPSLAGARNASRDAGCLANLEQDSVCFNLYRFDHRNTWPQQWSDMIDYSDTQTAASMRCPSDANFHNLLACSYILADDEIDGRGVSLSSICDEHAPQIITASDIAPFHKHRNAGYLDGHAARVP